ncbi:hypothetical protein MTO96_001925 [Rhipicephalus appendiculatus]
MSDTDELAVQEFYKGKSVLITGVTGFLGKILLEKLLRSCPGIKQIFLLIRPRKGCKSKERLSSLLRSECFEHVHREHAEALEKLVAVDGDLTEPGLGLQPADYELLTREVSVVFHSAATIKFNETLRQAVEMNMEGTRKVLKLCHEMKKLQAVVHVSTAYCNCDCKKLDERIYPSHIHPQDIISCTKWMEEGMLAALTPQLLRAKPNTYVLAKFLSESLVAEEGGDLPVAIVRPSIVAASWKEPFPGWVDALNGSTSLLASCASGVMTTIVTDVKGIADIVPVDIVANLLIVVACQTAAKRARQRELEAAKEKHWETVEAQPPAVYNCVTGSLNKLVVGGCETLPGQVPASISIPRHLELPPCGYDIQPSLPVGHGVFPKLPAGSRRGPTESLHWPETTNGAVPGAVQECHGSREVLHHSDMGVLVQQHAAAPQ